MHEDLREQSHQDSETPGLYCTCDRLRDMSSVGRGSEFLHKFRNLLDSSGSVDHVSQLTLIDIHIEYSITQVNDI